jgi:hypothetical protein
MKARALALGAGMRLRPITHMFAEQFLPVANEAACFYGPDATAVAGSPVRPGSACGTGNWSLALGALIV